MIADLKRELKDASVSSNIPYEAMAMLMIVAELRRLSNADSLREVLTDSVNNLANTLAEHRMYSKG